MKTHRTPALVLAALAAATFLAPLGPAHADIFPPAAMSPNASNATLPLARANLGAAPGSGVNIVTDFGADPTGTVDSTTAIANAVATACNNASPIYQAKDVLIPAGLYKVSGKVPVTNACWIHGQNPQGGGVNAGATILRMTNNCANGDLFQFRGFGQLRISDLQIDTAGFGYCNGGASYARVQNGGTGGTYAVNDTITLTGGTFTTATVLKVTAVSGAQVTGAVIQTPGTYSVAPSSVAAVAQGSSSGTGTGATFNVVYADRAGISVSGPTTTLTADAASGATSLTVASIAGFSNGDTINIEQDNGVYKTTTVSGAPSGNTITLAAGLSFKASANHPVYDTYASGPVVENVVCSGFWDCVRVENAGKVAVRNLWAQDFGHDAVIKTSGAYPDNGVDRYQLMSWDANRGTANAGIEFLAGGDVALSEKSKTIGAKYGVLLNSYFGPTGTLLIEGNSLEEPTACTVKLHQSVSGAEYANVTVVGNEFSNIVGGIAAQDFCIDSGTPNTAPKWVRNVNFSHNISNGAVNTAVSMVSVQDGDNVTVSGNNLGNNAVAGPTAISIGGAATNVTEYGNTVAGFPTGAYGTILNSSLAPVLAKGGYSYKTVDAALRTAFTFDTTQAQGIQLLFASGGSTVFSQSYTNDGSNWHLTWKKSDGTNILDLRDDKLATFGAGVLGQVKTVTKTGNYSVVAADSGSYFDNTGASSEVDFTLPTYTAGLRYCFTVTAAQVLKVIAPTGTANTTGVMMGLAGAITPAHSGNVLLIVSGTLTNGTTADGASLQIRYGTGAAPTNGAALTGTTVGNNIADNNPVTNKTPFSVQAVVTGLTVGTAYWVDVGLAAITGGTASLATVSVSAVEL